jgi:hypothetical protein
VDVVDVQRAICGAAVHARTAELREQVLTNFGAVQGAVLILGALQWLVSRQSVGIEGNPLNMHRAHGRPAGEPVDP